MKQGKCHPSVDVCNKNHYFLYDQFSVKTRTTFPTGPPYIINTYLHTMSGFQRQLALIILDMVIILDSETVHVYILVHDSNFCYRRNSTLLQKNVLFKIIVNVFERVHILQC